MTPKHEEGAKCYSDSDDAIFVTMALALSFLFSGCASASQDDDAPPPFRKWPLGPMRFRTSYEKIY
jgi:hypothetical protein